MSAVCAPRFHVSDAAVAAVAAAAAAAVVVVVARCASASSTGDARRPVRQVSRRKRISAGGRESCAHRPRHASSLSASLILKRWVVELRVYNSGLDGAWIVRWSDGEGSRHVVT